MSFLSLESAREVYWACTIYAPRFQNTKPILSMLSTSRSLESIGAESCLNAAFSDTLDCSENPPPMLLLLGCHICTGCYRSIWVDGIGDMVLFRSFLDQYSSVFNVPKNDIQVLGCKSWEDVSDEIFSGYSVFAIDEHAYVKRQSQSFLNTQPGASVILDG